MLMFVEKMFAYVVPSSVHISYLKKETWITLITLTIKSVGEVCLVSYLLGFYLMAH